MFKNLIKTLTIGCLLISCGYSVDNIVNMNSIQYITTEISKEKGVENILDHLLSFKTKDINENLIKDTFKNYKSETLDLLQNEDQKATILKEACLIRLSTPECQKKCDEKGTGPQKTIICTLLNAMQIKSTDLKPEQIQDLTKSIIKFQKMNEK